VEKKFDDISVQSFGHNTAALDRQTDGRKWQNNIASCVIYGGDWSRFADDSSDL